jgi:hypothetical protein
MTPKNSPVQSKAVSPVTQPIVKQHELLWTGLQKAKIQEPPRYKVHWDHLLAEMSWMATDFRQERKWKIHLAKYLATEVIKWNKVIQENWNKKREERRRANGHIHSIGSILQQLQKELNYQQLNNSQSVSGVSIECINKSVPQVVNK